MFPADDVLVERTDGEADRSGDFQNDGSWMYRNVEKKKRNREGLLNAQIEDRERNTATFFPALIQ